MVLRGRNPCIEDHRSDGDREIGTSAVLSEVNWLVVLSASVLAGILSMLTSLAGLPEVKEDE